MDRPLARDCRSTVSGGDRASLVRHVANELVRVHPSLAIHSTLAELSPRHIREGGSLVLDDAQVIPLANRFYDTGFLQDRALLRGYEGDTVVTSTPVNRAFETYCREQLNLGSPEWLHCRPTQSKRGLAGTCWKDKDLREKLIQQVQEGKLQYLHPNMGTFPAWALGMLLSRAAGRKIKVIAPHPTLTTAVNNKVWFTRVTAKLLGTSHTPYSRPANSYSGLASLARQLGHRGSRLVIKMPDSAGGAGNLVFGADEFSHQGLGQVQKTLKKMLEPLGWNGHKTLLISCWETDVLSTPSIQAWIPPIADGAPIIEGVFEQMVHDETGIFEGSHPAHLPQHLHRALLQDGLALSELFQMLGYVGRCSFDTIIVGQSAEHARVEFIECNGRWGGTSIPMTLANRLLGGWRRRPYATRELMIPGLDRYRFSDLQRYLKKELYDTRNGRGWLVLYNPGRLKAVSGIDVLCLGKSQVQANERARVVAPELLSKIGRQVRNLPRVRYQEPGIRLQ